MGLSSCGLNVSLLLAMESLGQMISEAVFLWRVGFGKSDKEDMDAEKRLLRRLTLLLRPWKGGVGSGDEDVAPVVYNGSTTVTSLAYRTTCTN
jgi:hypothetical protein